MGNMQEVLTTAIQGESEIQSSTEFDPKQSALYRMASEIAYELSQWELNKTSQSSDLQAMHAKIVKSLKLKVKKKDKGTEYTFTIPKE